MRLKAIIIILSILISILSPICFKITFSSHENVSVIATLDVCHAKDSISAVSLDTPAINETQFTLYMLHSIASYDASRHLSKNILLVFQKEHPPRF
ncbi:hypothetical protein JZK55_14690 [Dissulfurispira thermophila]|uniref:Uncharacterized protein n=1 Tax=Dissulfurispira thermophila TaxID=2715679 RepID=A0A7G1H481_9BACT|nr:hypothetical protein JZK55_14690 [Dissulfurispira thermophila]